MAAQCVLATLARSSFPPLNDTRQKDPAAKIKAKTFSLKSHPPLFRLIASPQAKFRSSDNEHV